MKKNLRNLIVFSTILAIAGCNTDTLLTNEGVDTSTPIVNEEVITDDYEALVISEANTSGIIITDALNTATTELSQEVKDALTYMYSEEGLAHDVYLNVYAIQSSVMQLKNIANNSEVRHIDWVNQLAQKYDLNITKYPDTEAPYSTSDLARYGSGEYPVSDIQDLYNLLYDKGIQSAQDALEVGCMVEVVDIDDLDKYIGYAQSSNASDVVSIFEALRSGSYTHYWAFDAGLKNIGISTGCCSVPDYGEHNFCHTEYPH